MKEQITQYLSNLEKENEVQILLACETGSRAWGFPSPDSDYDVRILYKHAPEWYLRINEPKDSIECMLDDNLIDISGWDIRKASKLLWKSNAPLLERLQSPIIYKEKAGFREAYYALAERCYSPIASVYHYVGLAKKAYDDVGSTNEYKLKRLFYALRSAMACDWIFTTGKVVPIEFRIMLENLPLESSMKQRIYELIEFKSTQSEGYLHSGERPIMEYIQRCIEKTDRDASILPSAKGDMNEVNAFLFETTQLR